MTEQNKKKAFTLAEVLITLGIIGVVAALTMPTLIQNHQKQSYVAGAKKAYSTVANMLNQMAADENVTSWADTTLGNSICKGYSDDCLGLGADDGYFSKGVLERVIPKYLKVVKVSNVSNNSEAVIYTKYDWDDNNNKFKGNGSIYSEEARGLAFYTNDSMIYYITTDGFGGSLLFNVDINGEKGPNIVGRDYFEISCSPNNNKCSAASDAEYLKYLSENGWKMDY